MTPVNVPICFRPFIGTPITPFLTSGPFCRNQLPVFTGGLAIKDVPCRPRKLESMVRNWPNSTLHVNEDIKYPGSPRPKKEGTL